MVRLYTIFDFQDFDTEYWLTRLPPWRRQRAEGYANEKDRRNAAAAYMLLLRGLEADFGIHNPQIALAEGGKPYLPAHPGIHFSLSHCPLGCACAIADGPVGVDIQDVRKLSPRLAQRVCAPGELEILQSSNDPALDFTKIWAQKESYLKMTGEGITRPLAGVDTTGLDITAMVEKGCVIALCTG